jgi:hypothetical protein
MNPTSESCDTTFGNPGMQLGGAALKQEAGQFGMNDPALTIPMPVSPSQYVIPDSPATTAYWAIGQESDTVTPLQEAMFAAAIANGGTLMKPYRLPADPRRADRRNRHRLERHQGARRRDLRRFRARGRLHRGGRGGAWRRLRRHRRRPDRRRRHQGVPGARVTGEQAGGRDRLDGRGPGPGAAHQLGPDLLAGRGADAGLQQQDCHLIQRHRPVRQARRQPAGVQGQRLRCVTSRRNAPATASSGPGRQPSAGAGSLVPCSLGWGKGVVRVHGGLLVVADLPLQEARCH